MPMLASFGASSARGFGRGRGGVFSGLTFIPTGGGTTILWNKETNLSLNATKEYTVTTNINMSVAIKMWGGGGALGYTYNQPPSDTTNQSAGGGGGYTYGIIDFQPGTNYIFQIGEGGDRATSGGSGADWRAGSAQNIHSGYGATEGAGYSGIFVTNASQANSLLIAGGGGAGGDARYTGATNPVAAGGGAIGQSAVNGGLQGGKGGTQSAGGAPSQYTSATAGSALLGGLGGYELASVHGSLGGGGGGYFGGGGGNVGGGGGGSGYFKPSSPVSSGVTTTGDQSTPANSGDALRSGAGQGAYVGYGSTRGADGAIVLLTV